MRGRKASSRANSPSKGDAYPLTLNPVATPPAATISRPQDPLLQKKYRELVRQHLGNLLDKLFAEFTGFHFHVAWAPPPPHEWNNRALPTGCSLCCRLSGSPLRPGCQSCGPKQLAHALSVGGAGHRFTCHLGVRNYWLALRLREETLGIAYLQALDANTGKRPVRKNSARAGTIVSSRLEFARAARLLRFVVQHVETASLADLRKIDLTSAGRAVLTLEKEQARLHEALQRHLPRVARHSGSGSHTEQIVHSLMDHIERDYAKPLTLRQCASELGMNAAYLSALFSQTVGVPFKTRLTEMRLAKARTLLGDSAKNLSAVAAAVGYASENRFRIAFKKATGLSPTLWRETMQANPPPPG